MNFHFSKFRLDKPEPIPTAKTKVDEFKLLNETVQRLLKRNVDIYNSQKDFIENASHELQTPLAISINKLETLADNNQLPEEQLKLLAAALDNLDRLTRLNKSLLLLSKIENRQFADEIPVTINQLVQKAVDDFADQSQFNHLKVEVVEQDTCIHILNADLAAILIINLIKNAIVHNEPEGFVKISITKNSLSVENSGQHKILDPEKIFRRFHSDQPSSVSTGLGLAMVKAIADLYHFKAVYRYDRHHVVTIHF